MSDERSFVDFVRRIRAGDDDAAETLVRRYEPVIRREVRSRIEDARLNRPASGSDWEHLTRNDLCCASRIVFSPDQMRLVTLQPLGEMTGWIWNLAAMRRELAQRGLDWPADVLRCEASSLEPKPLKVVMDDSGLFRLIDILERQGLHLKAAARP